MPDDLEQLADAYAETLDGQLDDADESVSEGDEDGEKGDGRTGATGATGDDKETGDAEPSYEVRAAGKTEKIPLSKLIEGYQKGVGYEKRMAALKAKETQMAADAKYAAVGREIEEIASADEEVKAWLVSKARSFAANQPPRDPRVDQLLARQEEAELASLAPKWLGRAPTAGEIDLARESYPGLSLADAYLLANKDAILTYRTKAAEKTTLAKLEESRKKAGPGRASAKAPDKALSEKEWWESQRSAIAEAWSE